MSNVYSILIFDKVESWLEVYQLLLQETGFSLFSASQCKDAINILERQKIDLIIGELAFSVDATNLFRWVRAKKPFLPILLITGGSFAFSEIDISRMKETNVSILFKESLDHEGFLRTVYTMLGEPFKVTPTIIPDEIITFELNGEWNVLDFSVFFTLVRNAYIFWILTNGNYLNKLITLQKYEFFKDLLMIEINDVCSTLRIKQIQYASPGIISFFSGLGEPIKEIREFFNDLISSVARWKKENIEVKLKEREVRKADLELQEKELDLERKRQETKLAMKKLETETSIELDDKILQHIEKRLDVLRRLGTAEEELGKLLSQPLFQSMYSNSTKYLIEEGKLLLPKQQE